MASQLSSINLISDRYASALYELAIEANKVDATINDLKLVQKIIGGNKDLKLLIKSPLISSQDKLKVFMKIFSNQGINDLTDNFLKVIANNKRFAYLSLIISQFMKINSAKRGDVTAEITSADELTEEQKNEIVNKLKVKLGDKLSLNYKIDNSIIGGLIVKVGSKMIDSSLVSKINKLKIAMRGT
ncbi:MAG: ATP synthase subunit delta [Alphaproteobacteria bacterium MarineAlpha5_Bin6]|nr:MAG: ATP synthase subunit delta [Alphaproteobacteria bacterium MarineAlpha5_Bin7]PPR53747.1 MAG: ATP synthase subunit delta [Alphaproteobacteria bacterium MarineAlpha5_Bin6]